MDKLHVRPGPAKIPPPPPRGDAFSALYTKHRAFVRSALLRRGISATNVEDLVQEVFIGEA